MQRKVQYLKGRFKAAPKITKCEFKGEHMVGDPLIKPFSLRTRRQEFVDKYSAVFYM